MSTAKEQHQHVDKQTGPKHGLWSDCIKPRSNRPIKTSTIGVVPPYLAKHYPTIKDNIVGNHVIQCYPSLPQDNRKHECGCLVRFGSWCRCPSNNERSGHNPTGTSLSSNPLARAQCIPERDRIIDLSWRTNDWCSMKTSASCAPGWPPKPRERCDPPPDSTTVYPTSNNKLFRERDYNVAFWREDLTTQLYHMELDSRQLQERAWTLENYLEATGIPLAVNKECLSSHQKRLDDDGWYNEVEETLCQEKHVIFKCREKMDDLLARAHAQILRNCEIGNALTFDLNNEHQSKSVDLRQHPLKFNSTRIGFHPGIAETNFSVITPEVWVRSVRENTRNCRTQRQLSRELCADIDRCIRGCQNEIWHRTNVVNNSFNARLKQRTGDRVILVDRLDSVNTELREMVRTLQLIRRSIREKETTKKLANARVEERERHLNMDVCSDTLLNSMKNDVKELCKAITMVTSKKADTEHKVSELKIERDSLEREIAVIDHDLSVDTLECMPLRQQLVIDSNGGPITKLSY